MAGISLVTGGCRSGKSRFALEKGNAFDGRKIFVATCPKIDDEMDQRIRKHQEERKGGNWETIEEPLELHNVFRNLSSNEEKILVVDCLSLWINNQLYKFQNEGKLLDESLVRKFVTNFLDAARSCSPGKVIFVTNEIGLGVVPESSLIRIYRDLLGLCNQIVAKEADEVYLLISGIPIRLKTEEGIKNERI
ncbi:putative bifunctional adenosylcobalamin biosynthesis protein CobP [Leptospira inadai serovar Lyme str. 10]|uniref:Adenosylcobinamide kinase n=2 Tax=Leptospira inadai serovar Lyme TaxID=293084 RepID=V6HSL2_9LEPT|nr:bifunctional adenosylcobinamide kinase/adenosylcobinamide-phosphate guanylyltransferase [Leptospira inadai]EQA35604.1 putative bifunctional adenosylcobalamin biosynthesis protein CobP [Leptospira inadai serovar Lyme str. 10]PNV71928.1 bifunctional adenosylcobinamide kinase/adenosylcobinamide-phosphate guanylyltransferase [Leptospira inadai serovar Lyme]